MLAKGPCHTALQLQYGHYSGCNKLHDENGRGSTLSTFASLSTHIRQVSLLNITSLHVSHICYAYARIS